MEATSQASLKLDENTVSFGRPTHNLKACCFCACYHIEPGFLGCHRGAAWGRCGNPRTPATSEHHGAESEPDPERGLSHGLRQSSSWCRIWSPLSRLRPRQSARCLTRGRQHGLKRDLKAKHWLSLITMNTSEKCQDHNGFNCSHLGHQMAPDTSCLCCGIRFWYLLFLAAPPGSAMKKRHSST